MNLVQRPKLIQAHDLRSRGLTYRQIGKQMGCAHSTAAHYVHEFEQHRAEIIESLAADLLVHTVSAIQTAEPDLHAQHINSARELRLLLNSLDQIEDRRQRRERRIYEDDVHDTEQHFRDIEEIARVMIETGQWQITQQDVDDLANPIFSSTSEQTSPKTSPSEGSLPRSRSGGAAKQTAPHSMRGRRGPTAHEGQHHSNSDHSRTTTIQSRTSTVQIRTESNTIEQDRTKVTQTSPSPGPAAPQTSQEQAPKPQIPAPRAPVAHTGANAPVRRLLRAALQPENLQTHESGRSASPKILRTSLINLP